MMRWVGGGGGGCVVVVVGRGECGMGERGSLFFSAHTASSGGLPQWPPHVGADEE